MQMFEVGGCVRDEILGIPSKDIDFSVVLEPGDFVPRRTKKGNLIQDEPFDVMVDILRGKGFKIFLQTREHLTVRAQFPRFDGRPGLVGADKRNLTADFVLARKEGTYTDGRRPDSVEVGTLHDDLARRDFTMNAVAKAPDGTLIDPFNGQADIAAGIIRTVGDPYERLSEDALRAVRALRFAVTKGFIIHPDTLTACHDPQVIDAIRNKISDERIQVELSKMFRYDTSSSLRILGYYFSQGFTDALFSGTVSLDATMKTKGRGR